MPDSLTVAIDEGALDRFADPHRVLADATRFAANVGVISTSTGYHAARIHDLDPDQVDFLTRLDRKKGLQQVRNNSDTERYVYIGTDIDAAEIAVSLDWEYLDVQAAAEAADWDCE